MADMLSQEEIDALREAVKSGDVAGEADAAAEPVDQIKVVAYNFRKPCLVSADQARTLQLLHESFAKSLQADWVTILKAQTELKLVAVDQITYGEFVLAVGNPTCISRLVAKPGFGSMIMEMSMSVAFPLIDILLGGDGREKAEIRELTVIERNVFANVVQVVLAELKEAWSSVVEVSFEMVAQESNIEYVQLVSADTACLASTFDIKVGDNTGVLNICYPITVLQAILARGEERLSSRQPQVDSKAAADANLMLNAMSVVPLGVRAVIGPTAIYAEEVAALKPGDVIMFDKSLDSPVDVYIEGNLAYNGVLGQKRRKVAVSLARLYSDENPGVVPEAKKKPGT